MVKQSHMISAHQDHLRKHPCMHTPGCTLSGLSFSAREEEKLSDSLSYRAAAHTKEPPEAVWGTEKKMCVRYEVVVGGRSITGLLKINLLMGTSVLREMGETAAGTEGCLCYLGAAMTVCSHKPVCSESLLLLPMPELWRVREVWHGWLPVRLHSNRLLRGKLHCS